MRWRLLQYDLPLARPLTTGLQGRRPGLILALSTEDGAFTGLGEAAPLPGLHPLDLRAAQAEIIAFFLDHRPPASAVARFAIEGAFLNLAACQQGIRPARVLAAAPAAAAPLNGLIDALHAPVARARVLAGEGYTAAKLKVGRLSLQDDAAAVWGIRQAVPHLALRLDANRAWSLAEARAFCRAIHGAEIAYLEEPLQDPTALSALFQEAGIPLALDESVTEDLDLDALPLGVRALVIKPTVTGGLSGAMRMATAAQQRHLLPVFSATFESSVGIRLMAEMACALGDPPPQGLATLEWLAADVANPPLQPRGGALYPEPHTLHTLSSLLEVASGQTLPSTHFTNNSL